VLIGPSAALVDPMQAMHRAPENSINQRVERRGPERLAGGRQHNRLIKTAWHSGLI